MFKLIKKIYWMLPFNVKSKRHFLDSLRSKGFIKTFLPFKLGATHVKADLFYKYSKEVLASSRLKSDMHEKELLGTKPVINNKLRLMAYYLTQFHPNDKNDEWWGKGVTEWNNVFRGTPQYLGHYQPTIPGELGAYDLRIKSNIARQIELAKNSGVEGFVFYYYWFEGERLLEEPLNLFLANPDLDIDFFICWANESWTRRFDGSNSEVLMQFEGDFESNKNFIDDNLNLFLDKRYIKVDGKPVIQIYRPANFSNVKSLIEHWRSRANELLGDIHFMAVSFGDDLKTDFVALGFDSISDFQPGTLLNYSKPKKINDSIDIINEDFVGVVYDYSNIAKLAPFRPGVYPAVMPSWDNTARRVDSGVIFNNSSPKLYEEWLNRTCVNVLKDNSLEHNFIFINAWNEWGEGAYLEPDKKFGYAYLNSTRRVIDTFNS